MRNPDHSGAVFTYPNRAVEPEHERVTHRLLAQRLARLQGLDFAGDYDPAARHAGPCYLVPSTTLVGLDLAARLNLAGEADLFGGVVPQAFIATKAITHPLVSPSAKAPPGWSSAFGEQVRDCVLEGYTAFSLADAKVAGLRLLKGGALRVKPVNATAGRGQVRVDSEASLNEALAAADERELESCGLVLERHLEDVTTVSVGQARVGERIVSYHGIQHLTRDNDEQWVYGGSELWVVAGDFDALLARPLEEDVRLAVDQARIYDRAASSCYPQFFASRRNYDIARGRDADGQPRSGVLEQSWRIGGASSAEIAALEFFQRPSAPSLVHACSLEIYGEGQPIPAGATVLFQGFDADVGYISKCVTVGDYGDSM